MKRNPTPAAPSLRSPWLAGIVLLAAALLLMGLGGGNGDEEDSIPIPSRSYSVTLTDNKGNSLEGERFTWEGKVHIRAQFGNATITIPFEKLRALEITGGAEPETVAARALLRSGDTIDVTIDATSKCYASTKFGNYEIFMADLASIAFHP